MAERRSLDYQDPASPIKFTQNLRDQPDGYDIEIGSDHVYLPSRCLPDLIRRETTTSHLVELMSNIDRSFGVVLESNNVSPEQYHIAILKLALLRTETERDYFIDKKVRAS